jgi:hypothetical protein
VWEKDWQAEPAPVTGWLTRDQCVAAIFAKWGRWPTFVYVSRALTVESFSRRHRDWVDRRAEPGVRRC